MPLEPEVSDIATTIIREMKDPSVVHGSALVSIAISLKRIADAIEGTPEKLGIVDGISQAIEYGINNATRR